MNIECHIDDDLSRYHNERTGCVHDRHVIKDNHTSTPSCNLLAHLHTNSGQTRCWNRVLALYLRLTL